MVEFVEQSLSIKYRNIPKAVLSHLRTFYCIMLDNKYITVYFLPSNLQHATKTLYKIAETKMTCYLCLSQKIENNYSKKKK